MENLETNTVVDISWELSKEFGGMEVKKTIHLMNISPEQSRILWMKRDHKTLQKIYNKSGNYEDIEFKQCMKMYENGGVEEGRENLTRNWSVRFLSPHDSKIIKHMEYENERKFYEECGGGFSWEDGRIITQKEQNKTLDDVMNLKTRS